MALPEALKKDKNVVRSRDGVEAFGLYLEFVQVHKVSGKLVQHTRVFLFQNSYSIYRRQAGKKAGRWKTYYGSSYDHALANFISVIKQAESVSIHEVVERGAPLLVQATAADLVAVHNQDRGGATCRWRGIGEIDRRCGKIDDNYVKPGAL